MKFLILGDIFGLEGKIGVASYLPFMKKQLNPDVIIANAENTSIGGKSLTKVDYDFLKKSGIDYFTMGNHTFDNKDIFSYIDQVDDLVRPANIKNIKNGKNFIIFKKNNKRILLFNLLGDVFMNVAVDKPFIVADKILKENEGKFDFVIIDFHGEATAEKIVFANYLSKKIKAIIFGTHTHIQTSDERILNENVAYITDVGMCGVFNSAIGIDFDSVEKRHLSNERQKIRFKEAEGRIRINAIFVTIYDNTSKPISIERIIINP